MSFVQQSFLKESITGARNIRSIFVTFILFLAGLGFFKTGFLSYTIKTFPELALQENNLQTIPFFPQGMTMLFYGSLALGIACYFFLTILWNIGSGYNLYSQVEQTIRLVRLGFPGKQREIFLSYEISRIQKLKFVVKQGVNPRATIFIVLKDLREIPLYPPQSFLNPLEIEKKAIELSNYFNLPLENLIL